MKMKRHEIQSSIAKDAIIDAINKALWKMILRIWIGLVSFIYSKKKHDEKTCSKIEHCVDQGHTSCLVHTQYML